MEAFVNCDELLANDPRMVVKELENPSDGKRFEVSFESRLVFTLDAFFSDFKGSPPIPPCPAVDWCLKPTESCC